MQINRRKMLAGSAALTIAGCAPKAPPAPSVTANAAMAELERKSGGRLGAFVLDTSSGRATGYRHDELFGMCSTFKMGLAAVVLTRADKGLLDLETELPYTDANMVPNSPVTKENLPKGAMSIVALPKPHRKPATTRRPIS